MKKHVFLGIIIATSLVTHFIFFGHPNEIVFDEVHFGKFISGYFTHQYFFDIHPPLAKLLISAVGYLADFRPGFSFTEIGQQFSDNSYLWLRLLPTLAGLFLPIVIYFLARRLKFSNVASFAAGMLVALDSALTIQSRFILLDSFLLLFGFLGLLFYLKYRDTNKISYLFWAGALGALSASVKWTGGTFLAIMVIWEIISIIKNKQLSIIRWLKPLMALVILPFAIYFSIFAIHLGLLTKSGPGDAFMTPGFQKTLVGNPNTSNPEIKPIGLFQKFVELNVQMYRTNATLTATHPYSSKWYTWPLMLRPIYYWYHAGQPTYPDMPATAERIYLLGNPAVWWSSSVATILLLVTLIIGIFSKAHREDKFYSPTAFVLVGAYLLNLLPFVGITRAMFLYHYFTTLVFAILILCYLLDYSKHKTYIFVGLILIVIILFVFFSPLTYGLPLTQDLYNLRVWFPSWI